MICARRKYRYGRHDAGDHPLPGCGCPSYSYEHMINAHTNNPQGIIPGVFWKKFPIYRWKPLNETNFPNNSGMPQPPNLGGKAGDEGVNIFDPLGSPQLLSDVNTCETWAKRCCDPSQTEWCNTKLTAAGPPHRVAPPWIPPNIELIKRLAWGGEVDNTDLLSVWDELRWRNSNDPVYSNVASMFSWDQPHSDDYM